MDLAWLEQSRYFAAIAVGFFGGVHCLGMCGGLISALSFTQSTKAAATNTSATKTHRFSMLLAYNLGRISSYALAGALAGGLGASFLSLTGLQLAQQILSLFAALFMLALGLYLAGLWQGVARLERIGSVFWRKLEPLSRRFIPIQTPWQALPFGMIWGWLPCGMVYSILIWSLSAGSAGQGLLLMLAFGIGTLPNLLLMGTAANQLTQFSRRPAIRLGAGVMVSLLGLIMLWRLVTGF